MVKGKKVGKYELGKTLGMGSFSKVKLGIDDKGNKYAVKIIEKEQLVRERMEEQLKREISVMKLLKHPHIVQLHDVLQTANHIYLVLELVTGGELFDRIIAAKCFSEDVARRFFQQLVVALHYCHKNAVAHRDLKPENLLVDDKGNVKITDFGLANLQKPVDKMLRTVCGTPNYVAPEVLKECGYNGIIADVWSAGVILFVMMAGYQPFDVPDLPELFKTIQRGEYRMHKSFSDPAKDLISRMLVVDPRKRLTLEGVMRHPWFQKGFDKAMMELAGPSGNVTVQSVDSHTGGNMSREQDISAAKQHAMDEVAKQRMGAFELISQLTSITMVGLTSATPVIKLYTRFFIRRSLSDAMRRVVAVLETLKANPKPRDDRELKGFINSPKGLLTYMVNLVPTVCDDLTVVEVRRGRGDTFDFHATYRALVDGLGSEVRSSHLASTGDAAQ